MELNSSNSPHSSVPIEAGVTGVCGMPTWYVGARIPNLTLVMAQQVLSND